jgi:predicted O-linked N-acetylglucosamine transferase (SPINDLY family)
MTADEVRERLRSAWLLHQQENLDGAERQYRALLSEFPDQADALHLLGVLRAQRGDFSDAADLIGRAVALAPGNAGAQYNLGNVLRSLNRREEALSSYDRALAAAPENAAAWTNRGAVLQELRRPNEAMASFDRALSIDSGHVTAHYNRGNALRDLGRPEEALTNYRHTLALAPNYAPAWDAIGAVLQDSRRFEEALAAYARAYALDPDIPYVEGWRLHAKMQLCEWSGLAADIARLENNVHAGKLAAAPFVLLACSGSSAVQLIGGRRYAEDKYPPEPLPWRTERHDHERIRVGYISGEFREQATAYLTADLFETHDRNAFEIHGFAIGPSDSSPMRRRLERAFDVFRDAAGSSQRDVAHLIRKSEIDVLVNLNGYFGAEQTGVFAFRPAPIQINYLGFPGTMGAAYVDYIVADRIVIPEGQQGHFSEKIAYLPECYQCNDRKRPIATKLFTRLETGLPEQGFVFCCFNSSHKLTPDVFATWMRILDQVDDSVLWLLDSNPAVRRNLPREAARLGIAPNRLVFAPMMKLEDHLARLKLADLVLDTLPHNAHTTASDALWCGVPVLTLVGSTFAGRVAASLLKAAGLEELVTLTAADYEALALKLARDVSLMAGLRSKLSINRENCALFNTPRFARHIEAAYKAMYERLRRGLPPASFAVEALPG